MFLFFTFIIRGKNRVVLHESDDVLAMIVTTTVITIIIIIKLKKKLDQRRRDREARDRQDWTSISFLTNIA